MRRGLFLSLVGIAVALPAQAVDPYGIRFRSPQGHWEAGFDAPEPDMRSDPDKTTPADTVRHRRYLISFYRPGSGTVAASTPYHDIYRGSEPTPVHLLFKELLWSPQEDFAILPEEQWPEGKGAAGRRIVSLNPEVAWQVLPFPIQTAGLFWTDRWTAVGEVNENCSRNVVRFDGREGKTVPLMEASRSFGYRIASKNERGIVLQRVATSCATEEEAKRLKPDCVTLDLSFMRRAIGSCPR
jgi:hypothetical protein